jgi:copper chaperone CopZ
MFMKILSCIVFLVFLFIGFNALSCSLCSHADESHKSSHEAGSVNHVVLKITGMQSEHCVKAVEDTLTSLNGISHVNVDLKKGEAGVHYDNKKVKISDMIANIKKVGFTAEEKK